MEPTHHWIQSALKVHSRKEQQQYQQTAIQFLMKEDTLLYTLIAESGRDFFKFFKASTAWFLSAQHCLLFLTVLIRALVCRRPKFNCVSLTITFPSTPRTVFQHFGQQQSSFSIRHYSNASVNAMAGATVKYAMILPLHTSRLHATYRLWLRFFGLSSLPVSQSANQLAMYRSQKRQALATFVYDGRSET